MDQETLKAEPRKETGTVAARRFRRAGRIPAVVYGHKEDPVPILLQAEDVQHVVAHRIKMVKLRIGQKTEQVLVKDVQFDTFGDRALHLDFERVAMDDRIVVECPIELTGTAKGAAAGGIVEHPVTDIEVECTPASIPESIRVPISDLAIGDTIHVRDIKVPEGVRVLTDPDAILVTIRPPFKAGIEEAAVEEAEAAPEEPEVIGRQKEEEPEE